MSPVFRLVLLVPFLIAFAGTAVAATPSVAERLQALGLDYVIDEDGDYRITISYPRDKRRQLVFVGGRTASLGEFAVREVFAPAAPVAHLDPGRALELLEANRGAKLGAWEADPEMLYFVIKLPDTVDAAELGIAIQVAAEMADDMEIALSGGEDRF